MFISQLVASLERTKGCGPVGGDVGFEVSKAQLLSLSACGLQIRKEALIYGCSAMPASCHDPHPDGHGFAHETLSKPLVQLFLLGRALVTVSLSTAIGP